MLILFISVDDIHNVDAELGEQEDTVAIAELLATGGAFVFLEPGIADSHTGLGLDAPMAGKDPGITVLASKGNQVTLQTAILHGTVESERYLGIAYIEVAIDEVALDIALMEGDITQPTTDIGRDEQMAPLLVLILVDIPGI